MGKLMFYQSTRGAKLGRFSDILLQGLAPDGGLAMPISIPKFDLKTIQSWRNLSYDELAYEVMSPFIDDIPEADLKALLKKTYTESAFHSKEITPLTELNPKLFLLELSNGPSLAFKDMALQLLGNLFAYVLEKRQLKLNILGATSGDTGSAAEYAVLGKKNINIFMLSPHNRMSAFQQAQMYSLNEPNIFNLAVKGVFDDCQDLVKILNADENFKNKYQIGAVNSINWARILAQSVYYFKAYLSQNNDEINVIVPSGNFGNIFSGYLAKQMGLPINQLIVATNENDVLNEFFNTGKYRPRLNHEVHETSSPSMDIGKASNFERYLYLIANQNAELIADLWQQLNKNGEFNLKGTSVWTAIQQSGFSAYCSNHQERIKEIRQIYQDYQRVIDPHTADGISAYRQSQSSEPFIVLETALPTKFAQTVKDALGFEPSRPKRFDGIEALPRQVSVLENDADALKRFIIEKLNY